MQEHQSLFHAVLHVHEKWQIKLNFEQPFRMKYKSKTIIRNPAEQENNSCDFYGHKKNFPPVVARSSIGLQGKGFFNNLLNCRLLFD